jgi:tape measure domain-containing protein
LPYGVIIPRAFLLYREIGMTVQLHFNADDSKALLSIAKINKGLDKLGLTANNTQKDVNKINKLDSKNAIRSIDAMNRSMHSLDKTVKSSISSFKSLATAAIAFSGISFGLSGFIKAGDQITSLENRLALVVGRNEELDYVRDTLYDIAGASSTSVQNSIDMFNRLGMTLGESYSTDEIISAVESIAYAAKISGGAAESLNAAMVQLSQGLASGELRGEELNSVLEQAPRIALAIADGLGVPFGELRELAKEGSLTSSAVLTALTSQTSILKEEAALMGTTVSSGFQVFSDGLGLLVGKFDQVLGLSSFLGSSLKNIGTIFAEMSKGVKQDFETLQSYFSLGAEIVLLFGDLAYLTFEPIISDFKSMVDGVINYSYNLLSGVMAPLQAFWDFVASIFHSLRMYIIGNTEYKDMIDGVVNYTKNLWARVKAAYQTFKAGIVSVFNNISSLVSSSFQDIVSSLSSFFRSNKTGAALSNFLKENFSAPLDTFKISRRLGASVQESLRAAFAVFKSNSPALKSILSGVGSFYKTISTFINKNFASALNTFRVSRKLGASIQESLRAAFAVFKGNSPVFKSTVGTILTFFNLVTTTLKNTFSSIVSFVRNNKYSKALVTFMQENFSAPLNTFKVSRRLGASIQESLKAAFAVFKGNSPLAKGIITTYKSFANTLDSIFGATYRKAKDIFIANRELGYSLFASVKQTIVTSLKSFTIVQDAIRIFKTIYGNVKATLTDFSKSVRNLFSFSGNFFENPVENIKTIFSDLSNFISNFLKEPMGNIGNAYVKGINYLNSKIEQGASFLAESISINLSDILLVGTLGAIALSFEGARTILFGALKRLIFLSFLPLLNNTAITGVIGLWTESLVSYMISSLNDEAKRVSSTAISDITESLFIEGKPNESTIGLFVRSVNNALNAIGGSSVAAITTAITGSEELGISAGKELGSITGQALGIALAAAMFSPVRAAIGSLFGAIFFEELQGNARRIQSGLFGVFNSAMSPAAAKILTRNILYTFSIVSRLLGVGLGLAVSDAIVTAVGVDPNSLEALGIKIAAAIGGAILLGMAGPALLGMLAASSNQFLTKWVTILTGVAASNGAVGLLGARAILGMISRGFFAYSVIYSDMGKAVIENIANGISEGAGAYSGLIQAALTGSLIFGPRLIGVFAQRFGAVGFLAAFALVDALTDTNIIDQALGDLGFGGKWADSIITAIVAGIAAKRAGLPKRIAAALGLGIGLADAISDELAEKTGEESYWTRASDVIVAGFAGSVTAAMLTKNVYAAVAGGLMAGFAEAFKDVDWSAFVDSEIWSYDYWFNKGKDIASALTDGITSFGTKISLSIKEALGTITPAEQDRLNTRRLEDTKATRDIVQTDISTGNLIGYGFGDKQANAERKLAELNEEISVLEEVLAPAIVAENARREIIKQSTTEIEQAQAALEGYTILLEAGKNSYNTSELNSYIEAISRLNGVIAAGKLTILQATPTENSIATRRGFASGGWVSGSGTGTSDSIPAMLSNGEFVINARATKKFLPVLEAINSGKFGKFAAGGLPGPISSGTNMSNTVLGRNPIIDPRLNTVDNLYINRVDNALYEKGLGGISDKFIEDVLAGENLIPYDLALSSSSSTVNNAIAGIMKANGYIDGYTTEVEASGEATNKAANAAGKVAEASTVAKTKLEELKDQLKSIGERAIEVTTMTPAYFAETGLNGAELMLQSFKDGFSGFLKGELSFKDMVGGFLDTFTSNVIDNFVGGFTNAIFNKFDLTSLFGGLFSGAAGAGVTAGGGILSPNASSLMQGGTPVFVTNMGLGGAIGGSPAAGDTAASGGFFSGIQGFFSKITGLFSGLLNSIGNLFSGLFGGGGGGLGGLFSLFSGSSFLGGWASGGFVSGAGTGTSDSIMAMLSNGEYVVNAATTKRWLPFLETLNSNDGRLPAFANGGIVGPSNPSAFKTLQENNNNKDKQQQVFNINVSGDVSMQTRREIARMIPEITAGVNMTNRERGSR